MNTVAPRQQAQPRDLPAAGSADNYLFGKTTTLKVFSLFCLMMILDFADRMIIAALLPSIRADWHITDAQAGMLSSALFVGMVVFAVPTAIAIDRWSRVKTSALMGAFWSLASGAGAFAQNITQLAVSRAAVGAGEAGYTPAASVWIMAAFPLRRRQLALGVFVAGQPLGMALGVALGGYIASHYGWRHALGIMAVPGFAIAFLLYRARDYKSSPPPISTDDSRKSASFLANLRTVFRTRTLPLIYLNSAMIIMQGASVFYFLPTFLNRIHAVPLETASYMTSGAMLLGIVAAPLGGWVMDMWTVRAKGAKVAYALLCSLVGTAIYGIAFGLADDMLVQYVLIVSALAILTSGATGSIGMTQELVHPGIRALAMTCNTLTAHLLGSVPGPVLTGLISDRTDLGFALLCITLCSGAMSVLALYFTRRYYLDDLARVATLKVEAD